MLERIQEFLHRLSTGSPSDRRASQREIDDYRRQLIIFGVSITAIVLVVVLSVGAVYQYVYLPQQTVATVNGEEIKQSDYWKYRKYQLLSQLNQLQQMAQSATGEQGQQYQQIAQQTAEQYQNVENEDPDPMTVSTMVENELLMQSLDDFDLEITDDEVDRFLVQYFTGTSVDEDGEIDEDGTQSELGADPTAEAWATATAEALQEEAEATEEAAEEDDADAETDAESEQEEPTEEPTPDPEDVFATATAVAEQHETNFLDEVGMSEDDFIRLNIKPIMAREEIRTELGEEVPLRAEQVNASHILVATEDAAQAIVDQLEDGADFEELAEEQSIDTQTAPNGGDLGWFPEGIMVPAFDEVAFDLDEGEISDPVETEFGWHIIRVEEREEDRPIELQTLSALRAERFSAWLEEVKAEADIDQPGDDQTPDMPGQQPGQFAPPPSAPDPPQPEMNINPEDLEEQPEDPEGQTEDDEDVAP